MNLTLRGSTVINASLALLAGVLGSLFTLIITSNLKVPVFSDTAQLEDTDSTLTPGSSIADMEGGPRSLELDPDPDTALSQDLQVSLDTLRSSLADASAERTQLAQAVRQLAVQIENLESDAINANSINALESELDQQQAIDSDFGQAQVQVSDAERRIENLVAAGVDLNVAQSFQTRQDQYQLDRLDLFDRAEREGWIDSEQFDTSLAQLDETRVDLREELGDEGYDRYLFEAGRNNRVVIANVIEGSAAQFAGVQVGDVVIAYANERVFTTRDLQQATRAGVRGESVTMNVRRQGQDLFLDVQRGPLGVSLEAQQQSPS